MGLLFDYYRDTGGIHYIPFEVAFRCMLDQLFSNASEYNQESAVGAQSKIGRLHDAVQHLLREQASMSVAYVSCVHGDINVRENVIRTADGSLWFLDWELARAGNVLYDFFYMLFHESLRYGDPCNSPMVQFFLDRSRQEEILELLQRDLGVKPHTHELLAYLLITIVDMLNTKVLILKKKRVPALLTDRIVAARLHGVSKILDYCEDVFRIIL